MQVGEGSTAPMPEAGLALSLPQLWGEEEKEITDLPMIGTTEPVVAKTPVVTM